MRTAVPCSSFELLKYDWRSIAKAMDYSDAHTAEVQFRKKLSRALKRLGSTLRVKAKGSENSDD